MVNLAEGLFCNMDKKRLYDFCSDDTQSGCFYATLNSFIPKRYIMPRNLGEGVEEDE